MGLSITVC